MIIDNFTSMDYLFVVVKSALNDLLPGEEFTIKDLFRPFEWNRLDEEIREELSNFLFEYAKDSDTIGLITESEEEDQLYIKL